MTITPASLRLDLKSSRPGTGKKCGNSYIPANAECTVGQGTQTKQSKPITSGADLYNTKGKRKSANATAFWASKAQTNTTGKKVRNVLEKGTNVLGTVAQAAGVFQAYKGAFKGNLSEFSGGLSAIAAGTALKRTAASARAFRQGNNKLGMDLMRGANFYGGLSVTALRARSGFKEIDRMQQENRRSAEEYQAWQDTVKNANSRYGQRSANGNDPRTGTNQRQAQEQYAKNRRAEQEAYQRAKSAADAPSAYKDLGVKPNASDDEVRQAWKKAARKAHPDMGGTTEEMQRLNKSFEDIMRSRGRKDAVWATGFTMDDFLNDF